jgi:TPR repeat protein
MRDANTARAELLRKPAEHGIPDAQYELGQQYVSGKGVPADAKKGLQLIRDAVLHGSEAATRVFEQIAKQHEGELLAADAEFLVGYRREQFERNYEAAMIWYRKAAAKGSSLAQTAIGYMYERGLGVPADFADAVRWYRMAASYGDVTAQSNLGLMLLQGKGIQQDYAEAARWFQRSAVQGWRDGQANLSSMYFTGRGVERDLVTAYVWCELAARSGLKDCNKILRILVPMMTPQQISTALARADAWHPLIEHCDRVALGGTVAASYLTRKVDPEYPFAAKQGRVQGTVSFEASIGKDGLIRKLQLMQGHPLLVPSAQEAVKQWVYRPIQVNGEPVEVETRIDVVFTLSQ